MPNKNADIVEFCETRIQELHHQFVALDDDDVFGKVENLGRQTSFREIIAFVGNNLSPDNRAS